MRSALESFLAALPEASADPEVQIRAVLGPIVERALSAPSTQPIPPDPSTCPNCGKPATSDRSPYCSTRCREMAALVRRLRAALTTGVYADPERQAGLGQALWSLQGGGYPRRQAMIIEKIKGQVIAKAGGACALCGAEATEIDHVTTACNRPINLRAVCANCNRAKGFGEPVSNPEILALYDEIALRIGSSHPLRCCDDEAAWDWRAYLRLRAQPA